MTGPMLVVLSVVCGGNAPEGNSSLRDLEVVEERMIERWTASGAGLLDDVRKYVKALRPDGSWSDVDYGNQGRSGWKTVTHLYRVKSLAIAHRTSDLESAQVPGLLDASLRSLRFWVEHDFRNPNWWWNEIGVPMALGPALLLVGDAAPADVKARGVKILERAQLGRGTGQNLVWLTEMALVRACVERRPEVVAKAFARIAEEVRVTTSEGIQPDFSFHQHGAQLYSGGYGFGFSVDVPRIAVLARGTSFAFRPETIETLTRYLLDGQQWMVHGGTFDHAAVGREITRHGRRVTGRRMGHRAAALERACGDLILLGAPRGDELRAFAGRLQGQDPDEEKPFEGHRHFWRSDFTVHRRRGVSSSVKMASSRMRGWELVNSEGLRSHYTADGMHLLYRRGDEYVGIFGVWDWLCVPGTTTLQSEDGFREQETRGTTSFVGGVSDGEYGVTALELVRGKLEARKAWFFFDDEIVCLGSGIQCDAAEPVFTAVNQCLQRGDVTTSDEAGRTASDGLWWVHHNGVGYVVSSRDRLRVKLSVGPQTGSWRAINRSYPDEPVTLDVFRLWIDHGKRPDGDTYAYAIVPDKDPAALGTCCWPVETIANRPELQAVRHRKLGLTGLVFYSPGIVEVAPGQTVQVNEPCILLIREGAGVVSLAAASPEQREIALVVSLSLPLDGIGAERTASGGTRVTLDLPGGPLAGSSVVRTLRLNRGGL